MLWFIYVVLFVTGAAVGSFLNVLISRSIEGESWVTGRSKCDHCGKTLKWYDMVPIFSYAFYGGRSRCCKKTLSLQHPIVEALTGILFVWWLAIGSIFFRLLGHPLLFMQYGYWLLIGIFLLIIFVTDLFYGLIPMFFVWGGIVLTTLYRLILWYVGIYQLRDFWLSLVSAFGAYTFFLFLRVITKGKGMGEGDLYLAILVGLILGWPKVAVGILGSFVLGAVISVGLMLYGSKKMKSTVPFGPFMIAATALTLVGGEYFIGKIIGF